MTAQTIHSFDRSPVPTRSAVAVRPTDSKKLGRISDYVDDFDPFGGVFALFSHLLILTVMFVLQLGLPWRPPPQPVPMEVSLVPELPQAVEQSQALPPTTAVRPHDSVAPLGKGNDPSETFSKKAEASGRPVVGPMNMPSEDRLLNESPKPMSSQTADPKASTAATPVPFNADESKNNADKAARSAALETKPAGTVQETVVPTAPDEGEPGGPKDAGEGIVMAAAKIQGAKPHYPLPALKQGLEGTVRLRVTVSADGRVTSVTVVETSGHAILDRAARDDVSRWRFSPARRATGPIASVIEVPIEFKLNN